MNFLKNAIGAATMMKRTSIPNDVLMMPTAMFPPLPWQ
jgi:hypothetical protein